MKRFLMAVFLAAFCLPVFAVEEVDWDGSVPHPNACDSEPAKGKLYKTKTGKTIDCRRYYVMNLYGYQGGEGNVSMGMDKQAMCQGTIYFCNYVGRGKFKRHPIHLSYVNGQCKSDYRLITVRFDEVNGSYAARKRLASDRLSHQCPGEVEKEEKPDDGKQPKPDDGKQPKPDDGKQPKPDDDKQTKPDDGNQTNGKASMEEVLRRLYDSLDRLNKNLEKSGSGIPGGSGNGSGSSGGGAGGSGGSGNGGAGGSGGSGSGGTGGSGSGGAGGSGSGSGSGSGKGNGKVSGSGSGSGNSDSDGEGYSPPKDPDWGRLGGVKAPRYSKDGRFSEVGACPQPVTFSLTVLGRSQTFAFSYEHVCDFAIRMRPILIACAYFAAGLICLAAFEK